MTKDNSGSYTFTIDASDAVPVGWSGVLEYPEAKYERVRFKLFSNNSRSFTRPFCEIGDHDKYVVHGWLNSCRPVTLLEPFYNASGGGELAKGFRQSTLLSGCVGDLVEGVHIDSGDAAAISEVGFWSETLVTIAHMQKNTKKATVCENDLQETKKISSEIEVADLGMLNFTITFRKDEYSRDHVDRAYTRLRASNGIDIWTAQQWAGFHLCFIDFLAGSSAGDFRTSVLANDPDNDGDQFDNHLRLSVYQRKKADHWREISLHQKNPIETIPRALMVAWKDDQIKDRILAVTTLRTATLGVFERFIRTIAYLEQWLRKRYRECSEKQENFKTYVKEYNKHMETASNEVEAFAKEFARPRYPQNNSLKDLLLLAFDECLPLGLACDEQRAQVIADRRNELAHGNEPSEKGQIDDLLVGSDIGLAVIELLTLKDLGLEPEKQFQPRRDRYGTQTGIYKLRASGDC